MKKVILVVIISLIILLFGIILSVIFLKNDSQNKEISSNIYNETENELNTNITNNNISENSIDNNEINSNYLNRTDISNITENEEEEPRNYTSVAQPVTNKTYYFTVQNCLKTYLENLTDFTYISKNSNLINITEMLELDIKDNNIIRFALRAILLNEQGQMYYSNFIVYLDYKNNTYFVRPVDSNITDLKTIDLKENINQINLNNNNRYSYAVVNDKELVKSYLDRFAIMCFNVPQIAYEYLDEEYRNMKFENVQNFIQYINENNQQIMRMILEKYEEIDENGYKKYICTDIAGRYYTIYATDIAHFTFRFGASY